MLCSLPVAIIGYAVIANTHNTSVKYGMTFLMATGLYSSVPPVLGWLSNVSSEAAPESCLLIATGEKNHAGLILTNNAS